MPGDVVTVSVTDEDTLRLVAGLLGVEPKGEIRQVNPAAIIMELQVRHAETLPGKIQRETTNEHEFPH